VSARRNAWLRAVACAALLAVTLGSCAYYNSYYLARKSYFLGTGGAPYPLAKPDPSQGHNFQKSIDYSKKVLSDYPKSKWVDDAYLLWAKALLGRDDPLQTINMLADYPTRFPRSPLKNEALFILGVAQRQARRYSDAEQSLGQFLQVAGRSPLVPYAELERARALSSLERYDDAAKAAGAVLEKNSKSLLVPEARDVRGEALFLGEHPAAARQDFHWLGAHAKTDEDRLTYLLRECDALEAAHDYDGELGLLRTALSHEVEPIPVPAITPAEAAAAGGSGIAGATGLTTAAPNASDHYGRLELRVGTAQLLAGRQKEALDAYGRVLQDYPRTPLGAEAQYRIGYVYETVLDDFETARLEYAKVRNQSSNSPYAPQAAARATNLDRLASFRSANGDTASKGAEGAFMLAEQYLFELDKPDRALAVYDSIATTWAGTPYAAKALNAQAWVLRRKNQNAQADSLLWRVVRDYPATEGQLAARDYLESRGQTVPESMIRLPEPPPEPALAADSLHLTQPPMVMPSLGGPTFGSTLPMMPVPPEAAGAHGAPHAPAIGTPTHLGGASPSHPTFGSPDSPYPAATDSLAHGGAVHQPGASPGGPLPQPDSLKARPPTVIAPADTTHH